MDDNEHETPVKVVDRRWWANQESHEPAAGGTATATASMKPTYVEELEQQLAEKDRVAQEYIAKYRQAAAEFEEARLRLRREVSKDIERGRRELLADLLEVLDNLDRAVESARGAASLDGVVQGVEMVRRQFLAKLEGFGVTRIDAEGQPFDPRYHEAVSTVPASSADKDHLIAGIVRHGYMIGDDVLRPASVAVTRST